MPKKFLLIILGIVINTPSFAAVPVETDLAGLAKDVFKKEFPKNSENNPDISLGDLNNDGLIDFASLLKDPTGSDLQIVVFLGDRNKTFKFYKASGSTFRHGRVFQLVQIKKGSIFLHRDGSGGCCSHWAENFQFKMRGNEIVLIGLEVVEFVAGNIPDDSGSSVNFLTNDVVRWRQKGKKRTEKKVKIPASELIKLEKFNYDEFTSNLPKGVY